MKETMFISACAVCGRSIHSNFESIGVALCNEHDFKFITLWKKHKTDNRFWVYENSKAKKVIKEMSTVSYDGNSAHCFSLFVNGSCIFTSKVFIFRCGYDRGPKRQSILDQIWDKG
jgi:hypothetical protein